MKDLQDDMRVVKRQLNIEEPKEKRMKFATDPTEGQPKDYCKDEFGWTKKDCSWAQIELEHHFFQ